MELLHLASEGAKLMTSSDAPGSVVFIHSSCDAHSSASSEILCDASSIEPRANIEEIKMKENEWKSALFSPYFGRDMDSTSAEYRQPIDCASDSAMISDGQPME